MKKLFIHLPRNGGVTIQRIPELNSQLIKTTTDNYVEGYAATVAVTMKKYNEPYPCECHYDLEHARWRDFRTDFKKKYPIVAIIRNPWSRTVSRYMFNEQEVATGKLPKGYKSQAFDEFLEERHKWGNIPHFWHKAIRNWYPQKDHVVDDKGVLQCDCLRLEHLSSEAKGYFELSTTPKTQHVSNVGQKDYKEFYNDKTIQIVADWYKEDIDFFGFDFDSAATRNIWNI